MTLISYIWVIQVFLFVNLFFIWWNSYTQYFSTKFNLNYFVSFAISIVNLLIGLVYYYNNWFSELLQNTSVKLLTDDYFTHLSNWAYDDYISKMFVLLTIFTCTLLIIWIWDANQSKTDLISCILVTEFCLINVFIAKNILAFFVFFEFSAIPLIYLIGKKGPTFRKIKALYYFISYTLLGSSFFLTAIVLIFLKYQTFNMSVFNLMTNYDSTDYIIWICLFLAFSIKIPMMPFHLWLIEAHVEAPTVGSVILAALLLKIGGYGILKFCVLNMTEIATYFSPIIITIGLSSMVYASLAAFIQLDLKRAIAYSSIAHMNGGLVGLFVINKMGFLGCLAGMMSHGFVSAAMFLLAGFLYRTYHTKNLVYFGGLAQINPIFTIFFLFFCFSNVAFPGTFNFIGELYLILGIFDKSLVAGIFFVIASAVLFIYFIWLIGRICFGELNTHYFNGGHDITIIQQGVLTTLLFLTVVFGLNPSLLTGPVEIELFFLK